MAKATDKKAQEQANLAALEQAVAAKAAENGAVAAATPAKTAASAKAAPKTSAAKAPAKPAARKAAPKATAKPAAQKPQEAPAPAAPLRGTAIGQVETRGLVAAIEAADAMLKTAQVTLVGTERIGSGLVTVLVRGEVSAVTAAVARGSEAASRLGEVVSTNVIARPVDDLDSILPQG